MKLFRFVLCSASVPLTCTIASPQNVITDWDTIASTTIVSNAGTAPGAAGIWFAYTSIAVYDAVNSVHGRPFEPFYFRGFAPRYASDRAAAIAAAHRVLVHYFPDQQPNLDAQFKSSLQALSSGPREKSEGVEVGEAAAAALIAARTDDGLKADVPYTPGDGPGVWQPTPPNFPPPVTPWLGKMRPFTMRSADQFLPGGPTPLSSEEWVADYNLTRLYGAANSALRTPAQTEIALFWVVNTASQYSGVFNDLVQHYLLDLMDSARLQAVFWTGFADTAIGCFNAKYTYSFWRPVTAIQAGGGNSELKADPSWLPLGVTPGHPEYPAAHGCLTSAVSHLVADFFGTPKVQVTVTAGGFSDGVHTHVFEDTRDWLDEVYCAHFCGFPFQSFASGWRRTGPASSCAAIQESLPSRAPSRMILR
jgi:hypothetical protein